MPLKDQSEYIHFLMEQNKTVLAQNEELTKTVAELTAKIEELTKKISELTEQKNKNSNNSSKPPSSDGLKKPNKDRSLREKSNKTQGGQPGHDDSRLKINKENPDEIKELKPSRCKNCPNWERCKGTACAGEKRYIVDFEITQKILELVSLKITCPETCEELKGEFPDDVKGEIQYGKNIAALLVALNTVGAVSTDRVKEIAGSILGLPIAKGTIISMVSRCADKLDGFLCKVKDGILQSWEAYFDETGSRVEKKTGWVHCAVTREFTYLFFHEKRGTEAIDDMGILPLFKGIVHHDCWGPYFKYTEIEHAICCAHLLRELNGIIENHPEQKWASYFKNLLVNMKKTKEVSIINGDKAASRIYYDRYMNQYDDFLKAAVEMNPIPPRNPGKRGKIKKGKIRSLIDRLVDHKASVCRFFTDFTVDFDNNMAERAIRIVKTKTKVSGCFRSKEGIQDYLDVMSYVGTAKKHGKNAFEAIVHAFDGDTDFALNY